MLCVAAWVWFCLSTEFVALSPEDNTGGGGYTRALGLLGLGHRFGAPRRDWVHLRRRRRPVNNLGFDAAISNRVERRANDTGIPFLVWFSLHVN